MRLMTPTGRLASVGVCLGTPAASKLEFLELCALTRACTGCRLQATWKMSRRLADDRRLGTCRIVDRPRIGGEPVVDLVSHFDRIIRNRRRDNRAAYHRRAAIGSAARNQRDGSPITKQM